LVCLPRRSCLGSSSTTRGLLLIGTRRDHRLRLGFVLHAKRDSRGRTATDRSNAAHGPSRKGSAFGAQSRRGVGSAPEAVFAGAFLAGALRNGAARGAGLRTRLAAWHLLGL
jgi:hypothetical protein